MTAYAQDLREVLDAVEAAGVRKTFCGRQIYVGTTNATAGVNASDSNPGTSPDYPVSTLAQAYSLTVSGRGDIIYMMPGYTATLGTAAAANAITNTDIALVGLGEGDRRPKLTLGASTTSSLDVGVSATATDGVLLKNFVLAATATANITTSMLKLYGSCTVEDVDLLLGTGTSAAALGILTNANANRTTLRRVRLLGAATAGAADHTAGIQIVGGSQFTIDSCEMTGRFTAATKGAIYNVTTAVTNLQILNCRLQGTTTACAKLVDLVATTTGMIDGCRMQHLAGAGAGTPVTGAAMAWGTNYANGALATTMVAI